MKILALDTSTEACSVALFIDGEVMEEFAVIPRQHAARLLPMVQQILATADVSLNTLDAIAFGRGPGSFTGLRIAAGAAQGLAFAADLPVVPVSTLAAIAHRAHQETGVSEILACLDARIDEVYWARFSVIEQSGTNKVEQHSESPVAIRFLSEESLCAPEHLQFADHWQPCLAAGNGLLYFSRFPQATRDTIRQTHGEILPRAASIACLAASLVGTAGCVPAEQALPLYLRDKVTQD
jgi:tRNA threonylcarbamoyladenosine biosynthesis protein TsaB